MVGLAQTVTVKGEQDVFVAQAANVTVVDQVDGTATPQDGRG
jgi:hypothetical protein